MSEGDGREQPILTANNINIETIRDVFEDGVNDFNEALEPVHAVPQAAEADREAVPQAAPANREDVPIELETAPCIDTGLAAFLKKNSEGKAILKAYKASSKKKLPLKRTVRSRLVRLIIQREKDKALKNVEVDNVLEKFVIKTELFIQLSKEIELIFEGESASTYFTPYAQQGNEVLLANGKLWHHYNYTKKGLREDNLLRNKKPTKDDNVNLSVEEIEVINSDVNITWLHNHLEPWSEVTDRWKATFDIRRQTLLQTEQSVHDYINQFPCLKTQNAIHLFSIDFNLLFPDKVFIGEEDWNKIKIFLISSLQASTNIRDNNDAVLVGILASKELSPVREDFIVLYLLCYLISPKKIGKKKV